MGRPQQAWSAIFSVISQILLSIKTVLMFNRLSCEGMIPYGTYEFLPRLAVIVRKKPRLSTLRCLHIHSPEVKNFALKGFTRKGL